MFTLEQIIKMEEAVSTRKLPVDIKRLMEKRRYSGTEDKWVRIGDLPLHRILRAWAKEPGNTIVEPSHRILRNWPKETRDAG